MSAQRRDSEPLPSATVAPGQLAPADLAAYLPTLHDQLLIDFTQGLTIGSLFYLAALLLARSLTPDGLILLLGLSLLAFFGLLTALRLREAALALGLAVGIAANLLTPVLLFLLYLVGWMRGSRIYTTPWASLGLALFLVGAVIAQPIVIAAIDAEQPQTLFLLYLGPLALSTISCALCSHMVVGSAQHFAPEAVRTALGPTWLSLFALVLSACAVAGMALP